MIIGLTVNKVKYVLSRDESLIVMSFTDSQSIVSWRRFTGGLNLWMQSIGLLVHNWHVLGLSVNKLS